MANKEDQFSGEYSIGPNSHRDFRHNLTFFSLKLNLISMFLCVEHLVEVNMNNFKHF